MPGQSDACEGLEDESSCEVPGFSGVSGLCSDGVCIRSGCGDGFVRGAEDCDGDNLGESADCNEVGFHMSGPLRCTDECTYDVSDCSGYCGDDMVNGNELCDGSELNNKDCTDLGFYNPEGLACNTSACLFDTSSCTGFCGDGEISGGELCDAELLDGKDCTDLGFNAPEGLACNGACVFDTTSCTGSCGDGLISGSESCDGAALNSKDCTDFGFYNAEGLACDSASCSFNTSGCTGFCGDGEISGIELCDDALLDGKDCTDLGFYNPAGLSCNSACVFNTSACTGSCGDGQINGSEQCDGALLNGQDCRNLGYYFPDGLSCNPTACVFNPSGCAGRCGDGIIDTDAFEGCDMALANSNEPDSFCRANCQLRRCGDGIMDVLAGENCDDGNSVPGDGCSGVCLIEECGNGVVDFEIVGGGYQPSEDCDDGLNNLNHDGCIGVCQGEVPRWTREPVTSAPTPRTRGAMAYDASRERVVFFGGNIQGSTNSETWEWDGRRWVQRFPDNAPTPRKYHSMVYDAARNRVVLFGGARNGNAAFDTWEWDGTNWIERTPETTPTVSHNYAMTYDSGRQRVVMFGGSAGNYTGPTNDTWEWDGTNWTQVETNNAPSSRKGARMAYDPVRGNIVLHGGAPQYNWGDAYGDTWIYDGTDWTEVYPETSPGTRASSGMVYVASLGGALLWGGRLTDQSVSEETWLWDGNDWLDITTAGTPSPRYRHAMAYDMARDKVVMFGGSNHQGSGALPGTWEWDQDWTEVVPPPTSPSARYGHKVATDPVQGAILLFGGQSNTGRMADTWKWSNKEGWTQLTPSTSPSARYLHAMSEDSARGRVVLFGGYSSLSPYYMGDTWEWNGSNWTAMSPANAPSPRRFHSMAYDAARKRTVLFGGYAATGGYQSDTWEYDGITWAQLTPVTVPAARYGHTLSYDANRQRVVMFGGYVSGYSDETWEWDGTDWTLMTPTVQPPDRYLHGSAYDAARKRVLIFGGINSFTSGLDDIMEWDGVKWSEVPSLNVRPTGRYYATMGYDAADGSTLLFGGYAQTGYNGDTYTFQYAGGADEACFSGLDGDGDGNVGCEDPDCWAYCTPACLPGSTPNWPADCDTSAGILRCGDGSCSAGLESPRLCPADCGAPTAVCGDFFCDAPENAGNCPGDC